MNIQCFVVNSICFHSFAVFCGSSLKEKLAIIFSLGIFSELLLYFRGIFYDFVYI